MGETLLDVIVDVPAVGDRRFTYSCPQEICLPRGAKVRVPFARSSVDAFVVERSEGVPAFRVKPVEYVYDLDFLPAPDLLRLGERLAEHYCAPTAAIWSCMWPAVAPRKSVARLLKEGGVTPTSPDQMLPSKDRPALPDRSDGMAPDLVWGSPEARWERYMGEIRRTLSSGKGVLFLMPEIKGLRDALGRLSAEFPGDVCQIHSEMTGLLRREAWLSLARGEKRLAVGTRSAVFAPVRDLGLIVVDDESSTSYKSPEWPFYDGRFVARERAATGGRVLFGASHPSVEAVWRVSSNEWTCREEGEAKSESCTREVVFLDMREVKRSRDIISEPLREELGRAFGAGRRALLFLNRRGDSTQVSCQDCGSAIMCPECGLPLSHHAREGQMVCHTCGLRQKPPLVCPTCGGHRWRMSGYGIERAESEFRRVFPAIPVFRLDNDSSKAVPPDESLSRFAEVSPSCLIATQMVLGYTLPSGIAVVGVLSADTALSLPDYRASERAYQMLSRLSDLVEPGEGFKGRCVVQTRNPGHHAIRGVADRNFFYEIELRERRMLGYPPFRRFFKVKFGGKTLLRVKEAASEFARRVPADGEIRALGPVPAPKPRVRGQYWWQLALRGEDHEAMVDLCRRILAEISRIGAVKVLVDVDPIDME